LGQVVGTQADAEVHEYAWRYKAFLKGWRIYAKPPGVLIRDPRRRTTWQMKNLAHGLPGQSPRQHLDGMRRREAACFGVPSKWLLFYPGLLVAGPLILRLTLGYC